MRPKVLIEVYGGVVQRVAANKEVDVYLLDFDDLNQGTSPELSGPAGCVLHEFCR